MLTYLATPWLWSTPTSRDVSSNRINQPFDIDVFDKVSKHLMTRTVSVPFSVR